MAADAFHRTWWSWTSGCRTCPARRWPASFPAAAVTETSPILILTAKSAEEDRNPRARTGDDDYVTKPFSSRELVLRVQVIVRRGVRAARRLA